MLTAFKIIVVLVFLLFFVNISDFGNKNVKPLIRQPWLSIMRIGYPIAPLYFLYFLVSTNQLIATDYVALPMMSIGTTIVFSAKRTLGKRHSWTGFSSTEIDDFCKTGLYSWIRHPLYSGIAFAVLGTAFSVIPRGNTNLIIFILYLVGSILTFIFIGISSRKETDFLKEKFGKPYADYADQVYGFLPLRRIVKKGKRDKC